MNFKRDLAEIAKKEMISSGVVIDLKWDDYHTCFNYIETSKRWFNSTVPYIVVYSKELIAKIPFLSREEQAALKDIENCFVSCKPLTNYMSKWIYKTEMNKSDFLLKNWDIYHLHLEKLSAIKVKFKMPNLLFFQQKGNIVHFIDVRKHPNGPEWFLRDLLEIVYRNWPWLLRFMNDIRVEQTIPDEKIHNATKRMFYAIDFHGRTLMPTNMGVAASGNSSVAVMETNRLFNSLTKWEKYLTDNEAEIKRDIEKEHNLKINKSLDYELIIENGWFVAYEKDLLIKIKMFEVYKL